MTTLDHLLGELTTRILAADFVGAAALAPQIETALNGVSRTDQAALLRTRALAERNGRLLEAARKGIRAARRRVDEVRNAGLGLQSYDGQGRRADIPAGGRTAGRF